MIKLRISVPVVGLALFAVGCGDPVEDTTNTNATASVTNTTPGPVGPVAPGSTGTSVSPVGNTGLGPTGNTGLGPTGNTGGPTGNTVGPTGNTAGPTGNTANTGATTGPSGTTSTPAPTTTASETTPAPTTTAPVETTTPVEPGAPEPTLITSGNGSYWQVSEAMPGSGAATVTVNDGQAYQTIYGFGGSVNEKGWEALQAVSEADRKTAMELLFDREAGAAFRYIRIPIGASDYATSRYTLNENAGDYAMEQFSIERDKQLLIPYIKAALEVNPDIHFSSSPWTPPTWMKNNNGFDGGTNATIKDDNQTFQALALYLARFVEEYAKEGIEVKAVYPQNEPGFADQAYPMCGWTSAQMTKFVGQFMGPTFQERGLTAEIWMGTLSNTQTDAGIGQAAWADATAKPFIKAFGMQWGMDSTLGTFTSYGLPVWQSEHKCGNYPWNPGGTYVQPFNGNKAPNDHNYAMESWLYIKSWLTKGANGYMAWNMVLDTVGKSLDQNRVWPQNALLTVDTAAKRLIPTPAYYVFRHVSQYVDEGAKRVATQGGDAMAFKNPDGSVVTVLFNSGAQAAQTTLSAAGKTVQFSIPANGFATVNLSP